MTKYVCGPSWDRRLFDINPKGNIGLMITGGLDSWVMYHILKSQTSNFTLFNITRKDGFDSPQRIRLLTGQTVVEIEDVGEHTGRVAAGVDNILANHSVDQLYLALNRDPPIEHFPQFSMIGRPYRPWRIDHPKIVTPFLHLYKYHIIDVANCLNIDVNNTLSCINTRDRHCGKCWQCLERQWGYEQLNQP